MPATAARPRPIRVCIEATGKRAFASALDWPGWCRSGKDEDAALAQLDQHASRYAAVPARASLPFTVGEYTVIERMRGTPITDFGAPGVAAAAEREPLAPGDTNQLVALVAAAWTVFDEVVASAPPTLKKGPRGGGRDRDPIVEHVLGAEHAYGRKLGVRVPQPHVGGTGQITVAREAILAALRRELAAEIGADDRRWLPRYAARRISWHVIDHAWEMENRTER